MFYINPSSWKQIQNQNIIFTFLEIKLMIEYIYKKNTGMFRFFLYRTLEDTRT